MPAKNQRKEQQISSPPASPNSFVEVSESADSMRVAVRRRRGVAAPVIATALAIGLGCIAGLMGAAAAGVIPDSWHDDQGPMPFGLAQFFSEIATLLANKSDVAHALVTTSIAIICAILYGLAAYWLNSTVVDLSSARIQTAQRPLPIPWRRKYVVPTSKVARVFFDETQENVLTLDPHWKRDRLRPNHHELMLFRRVPGHGVIHSMRLEVAGGKTRELLSFVSDDPSVAEEIQRGVDVVLDAHGHQESRRSPDDAAVDSPPQETAPPKPVSTSPAESNPTDLTTDLTWAAIDSLQHLHARRHWSLTVVFPWLIAALAFGVMFYVEPMTRKHGDKDRYLKMGWKQAPVRRSGLFTNARGPGDKCYAYTVKGREYQFRSRWSVGSHAWYDPRHPKEHVTAHSIYHSVSTIALCIGILCALVGAEEVVRSIRKAAKAR